MEKIRKELDKHWNECIGLGLLNLSWRSILDSAYQAAAEKNQYQRCYYIAELIREDIYS